MKEIKAIIQPFMANYVLDALHRIEGVSGVMAFEVRCTSATRSNLNPDINTRIELVVPDELENEVVAAIQKHAHTGRKGDGRIFVTDVQRAIVIRAGEAQFIPATAEEVAASQNALPLSDQAILDESG